MKWAKAIEKDLPIADMGQRIYAKYRGSKILLKWFGNRWLFDDIYVNVTPSDLPDIEWLDEAESPSPSIEELAQKLREANPYKASSAFHEEAWDQCVDEMIKLSKEQANG